MDSKRESTQSGSDNGHQMDAKVSGYYLVPPDDNDAVPAKSSVDRFPPSASMGRSRPSGDWGLTTDLSIILQNWPVLISTRWTVTESRRLFFHFGFVGTDSPNPSFLEASFSSC